MGIKELRALYDDLVGKMPIDDGVFADIIGIPTTFGSDTFLRTDDGDVFTSSELRMVAVAIGKLADALDAENAWLDKTAEGA